jgi:uncharacterized protein
MSSEANKQRMQDLFSGRDRAAFAAMLHDDVVMRVTGQYSWSRTFRGKAALLGELHGHLNTLLAPGRRTIPQRFIAEGDIVVVEARGDMLTKAGVRYDNEYCLIFRLREGKIIEMTEYCDSVLTESVLGKFPAPRAA